MKYEQYLEWQRVTGERIAKALGRFSIKEGRNAQVFGSSVGIEVQGEAEQEPAEPTWFYLIYGTITTRETGSKFGPARAATILRSEPVTVTNDSLFVQSTGVIDIPEEIIRTKKVTYNVTTFQPGQYSPIKANFSDGIYRGGLKLICEFYYEEFGERVFVREYTLLVGRNGDSVTLSAPDPNKAYFLRIVRAERL